MTEVVKIQGENNMRIISIIVFALFAGPVCSNNNNENIISCAAAKAWGCSESLVTAIYKGAATNKVTGSGKSELFYCKVGVEGCQSMKTPNTILSTNKCI